jgi:RHS family protein
MNGASATVSAGGYSGTYHSSRTGHAEINGLNDFLDNNRLKGKDVHISDITGQFRTSGNKPVGMCTNCRTNIFDILKQGEAKSVSFPETRGNKVLGTIKIESSDFDKVRKELDAVRKLPGSDKTRSDAAWKVLHKYNKFGKCGGK